MRIIFQHQWTGLEMDCTTDYSFFIFFVFRSRMQHGKIHLCGFPPLSWRTSPPKLPLEDTALLSTCPGQNCCFLPKLPKHVPLVTCPLPTYLSERKELALSLAFYFSPLFFKWVFFKPEGCLKMLLLWTQQQGSQLREYEVSLSHWPKWGTVKFIINDEKQGR